MQIAADVTTPQSIPGATTLTDASTAVQPVFSQYKIIRRNGAVVGFEPGKISVAVTKAFLAVEGGQSAASARIRELVAALTDAVVSALVVMLAMHTTITERTREIGILKAMGASRRYIISEIEREALAISFLGLLVGFALAALGGLGIHKATGLIFEFGGWWALIAALIGLAGGALGALYPAARAANLDPVTALAYE